MGRLLWVGFAVLAGGSFGCHSSQMAKIEALRDGIAVGNTDNVIAAVDVPPCPAPHTEAALGPCLDAAAKAFGGKAFSVARPDQASAAAVAYVFVRDHEGLGIPKPQTWLEAAGGAKGPGADALRLALATAMADASPAVGKHIDDEPAARALLAAVAAAIPGACDTYGKLGAGAALTTLAPAEHPDHAACVQQDLVRKDGPGAAYGDGLWRAAAGAAALWKDASRALTIGFATTEGLTRKVIQKKLGVIDVATRDLAVRTVTTNQNAGYDSAAADHPARLGVGEAGVPATRPGASR